MVICYLFWDIYYYLINLHASCPIRELVGEEWSNLEPRGLHVRLQYLDINNLNLWYASHSIIESKHIGVLLEEFDIK
jgi:hypothetical protein